MEDVPYGRIVREGWVLVLICALLGAGGAYAVTRLLPETYASSATLLLQVDSSEASLFERNQFSLARITSYPELVDSPEVIAGVRSDLGLRDDDYSDRDLRRMLSAENTTGTVLLVVQADAPTAEMSADLANSAATRLSTLIEKTENSDTDNRYRVNMSLVLPAIEPLAPISPQVLAITGLGLILGVALGAIVAVYRTLTNRHIRTVSDVRRMGGQRVIGRLPRRRWRRADGDDAAFDETVANLEILAGTDVRRLLLVTASDDAVTTLELHALVHAGVRAGRTPAVIDTRSVRNAAVAPLRELLGDGAPADVETAAAGVPAAARVRVAEAEGGESSGKHDADTKLGAFYGGFEKVPVAELEERLPEAVARLGAEADLVIVVIEGSSVQLARTLAGDSMPVAVAARSGVTSASELVSVITKLGFAGVRPIGVLLTGVSPHYAGVVTETWRGDETPSAVVDGASPQA